VEEIGTWRKRYNLELYKVFNESDITRFIQVEGIEWVAHLISVTENRMIRKVLIKPEENRKVGRPRLRWEECV
jgi:hypothetical protein